MIFLVDLPEPVQVSVIAATIAVVALLVRLVSMYVPWLGMFLEKYKEEWGTSVGILLVNLLEQWLPGGEWVGVSILAVQLVVAVVIVVLGKYLFRKAGARGFK